MNNAASSTLFAYWDQLRAGRPAPDRAEVDPRAIAPVLGDTFILEAGRDGSLAYRLAGSRACALFARELKGSGFLDTFSPEARATLVRTLADALAAPAGLMATLTATSATGRTVALEAVILPLVHRGRLGGRLLGGISAGDPPYWIGRDPIAAVGVDAVRLLWPSWQGALAMAAATPVQPAPAAFTARPALRLIQGGNVA
jgi:hypothetical protein